MTRAEWHDLVFGTAFMAGVFYFADAMTADDVRSFMLGCMLTGVCILSRSDDV